MALVQPGPCADREWDLVQDNGRWLRAVVRWFFAVFAEEGVFWSMGMQATAFFSGHAVLF